MKVYHCISIGDMFPQCSGHPFVETPHLVSGPGSLHVRGPQVGVVQNIGQGVSLEVECEGVRYWDDTDLTADFPVSKLVTDPSDRLYPVYLSAVNSSVQIHSWSVAFPIEGVQMCRNLRSRGKSRQSESLNAPGGAFCHRVTHTFRCDR